MVIKNIKKSILLSKSGNPYAKILVQFEEYKDGKGNMRWIGGFGNKRTWAWRIGDDVTPEITEDGQYLNFTFDDTEENRLDVYGLPATIGFCMSLLGKKPENKPKPTEAQAPQVDDDIPF